MVREVLIDIGSSLTISILEVGQYSSAMQNGILQVPCSCKVLWEGVKNLVSMGNDFS